MTGTSGPRRHHALLCGFLLASSSLAPSLARAQSALPSPGAPPMTPPQQLPRSQPVAPAGPLAPAGAFPSSPSGGSSQPAPPFAELLRRTLGAPRQALLSAEVERAQGLAMQARARPNPSISLYGENFGGTSPYGGFGRTETTLQYNHPFELGGKRSSRIAAGQAGVVAAEARALEGRLTYSVDLARAYAAAEVAERRIALAEDEVEEATADLRLARALVGAGKEARLRQLQAQTELGTLEADLATRQAERVASLARLSALAGSETAFTGLSESLLSRLAARPASGPPDPMRTAAVLAADAERKAAGARVVAQRKYARPDVTAQIGVRRLEIDNATALVAGVALPLNIFDRNKGNIAAAEAELRGAEARSAIARLEATANANAAGNLLAAAEARTAAAQRTLGTAVETYRLARIAYEAGKSPLIELLAARHGLGIARGVVLDAEAARLNAYTDLARLQGLTITGEPVQ